MASFSRSEASLAPSSWIEPSGSTRVRLVGCGIDSEDRVWVADALGNRVCCVADGGQIVAEVSTGASGVYACALGGEDGHQLLMCAAPDFHADKRMAKREAALLVTTVDAVAQAI